MHDRGSFAGLGYLETARFVASGLTLQINAYDLQADQRLAPSEDLNCLTLISGGDYRENVACPDRAMKLGHPVAWGRLAFVPAGMPASFRTGACSLQACHLIFPNTKVEMLVGSPVFWAIDNLACYIDINDRSLALAMERLRREALVPGPAHETMMEALGSSIIIDLYRRFAAHGSTISGGKSKLAAWQSKRIEDYVRIHACDGDRSIAHIADICGISASHLSRCFRNTAGDTLPVYIDKVRMERAQTLLISSNMKLGNVAQACGYGNQAHFSTAFRRVLGETPSNFRRRMHRAAC